MCLKNYFWNYLPLHKSSYIYLHFHSVALAKWGMFCWYFWSLSFCTVLSCQYQSFTPDVTVSNNYWVQEDNSFQKFWKFKRKWGTFQKSTSQFLRRLSRYQLVCWHGFETVGAGLALKLILTKQADLRHNSLFLTFITCQIFTFDCNKIHSQVLHIVAEVNSWVNIFKDT